MLERIALHQTRLRAPGLGLDGKGIALGTRGLVLVPSLDRLVAWLSVYTSEHSLEDLMPSLEIALVRSKLGTREITLSFAAESSDRMDRAAETARLVGGYAFTGTSRHFVQYRDAAAPFGYDAAQLLSTDEPLVLYHDKFTQTYATDKAVDLRALLLRLMPHLDPATEEHDGPRVIVAEQGLGPALIHYFVRSRVEGEVCVGEWPPESAFDDAPVRRYIFRVPALPERMRPLLRGTPGLSSFLPAGPGVAVEIGYRHPVSLRACPVFDSAGLVLVRGGGSEPWVLEKVPQLGDLKAFARVSLREDGGEGATAHAIAAPLPLGVPLRLLPSPAPWRNVTATWLEPREVGLLRRMAYALPPQTLRRIQVAVTERGTFLRSASGIEAIPLGTFFTEIHPGLFIPAGYDVTPAVAPDVLHHALGAPAAKALFIDRSSRAYGVDESSFVSLETMLLEAHPWEPLVAETIERALDERPVELTLGSLGLAPMGRAVAPGEELPLPPAGPDGT